LLILGVDPGTAATGYGLVEFMRGSLSLVDCGCIQTAGTLTLADRLQILYQQLTGILRCYRPDQFAVEEVFFNKNIRTAMAVSQARGVILLAAADAGLAICEYTPLQVKQAVVGYGRATKQQVRFMVKSILRLSILPGPDDVADALAVAICHAHMSTGVGKIK